MLWLSFLHQDPLVAVPLSVLDEASSDRLCKPNSSHELGMRGQGERQMQIKNNTIDETAS